MTPLRLHLVAALAATLGLGLAVPLPAAAQTSQSQQQQQFSEHELKSFVVATKDIGDISKAYIPKIKAASSTEQEKALRKEATGKMIDAIKRVGLTVPRYNQIAAQARSDPKLLNKLKAYDSQMQ